MHGFLENTVERAARLGLAFALLLVPLVPTALLATEPATDLVVIVNPASGVTDMSAREIRKLFLGKSRQLPNGSRATLARFAPAGSAFNVRALSRSDAQVTAAWSRLKFSGRVSPPRSFDSAAELASFVESTPNAIAYLPADAAPENARIVFAVPH